MEEQGGEDGIVGERGGGRRRECWEQKGERRKTKEDRGGGRCGEKGEPGGGGHESIGAERTTPPQDRLGSRASRAAGQRQTPADSRATPGKAAQLIHLCRRHPSTGMRPQRPLPGPSPRRGAAAHRASHSPGCCRTSAAAEASPPPPRGAPPSSLTAARGQWPGGGRRTVTVPGGWGGGAGLAEARALSLKRPR